MTLLTPTTDATDVTTGATDTTVDRDDAAVVLAAARALASQLSARAAEIERHGTLPADLVEHFRAARLFRAIQPRALGGLELAPADVVDVVATLCEADASSGWTALIGMGGNAFTGWLDPDVASELLGTDADVTIATVFAPTGRLEPAAERRFDVSGRWPWASGCRHADWLLTGGFVFDGDAPRIVPERGPDWRLALFPRAEAEIIDGWDVMGLRGTGSNDVATAGLSIAEEHVISPFFEPARQDGPLWRLPFFTLAGIALVGFPLGVGRRALDELTALAPTKARAGSFVVLADDPAVQADLARAEAGLQAARAFVDAAVGSLWDAALAGDVPSIERRATFQLAAQHAMHAARDAVDMSFSTAGAGAIHADHPLQRCFRDLHAAAQHAYFGSAAMTRWAKVRFGIDQPLFML
jgi:alkylation response protein AidB-like acyl-CoA dehydrogenase